MEKTSKHKKFAAIALVLLMASVLLTLYTPVQAQYTNMQEGGSMPLPPGVTPDLTIDTVAYLSFRPNPVGVGQTILVNMWITPPLHVSHYISDYKVTITDPDGNEDVITLDSYRGDSTAWFEYVVDQVGTWTLKFDMPGGYFPPGNYTTHVGAFVGPQVNSFEESCYYKPSSTAEQELVVQEEAVLSWPPSPLPTDYWTRPVSPENREWWPILGNYPATGVVGGGTVWDELYPDTNIYAASNPDCEFIPYVQAPNTAHVVWRRQGAISGLIGGVMGQTSLTSGGGTPNIIFAGRCYDTLTKVVDGEPTSVFQCFDLRTGEVYWERTGMTQIPTMLSYHSEPMATVPGGGAFPGTLQLELMYVGGGRVIKYSPWTGAQTFEMSIAPLSSGTYYDTYPYFLTLQNIAGQRYLITWTIAGEHVAMGYQYEYTLGVVDNVTWPWTNLGDSMDLEAGIAFDVNSITPPAAGISTQTQIRAASFKTGAELWDKTIDERIYSGSCTVADHGKGAILSINGYFLAYDLQTGNLAWKSEAMDYPWSQCAFGAYDITSAYGMFYRQAYDGVYAFDWDTGKIVWKYKHLTPYEYETPYIDETGDSVYSFNSGAFVADGKLFTLNSEHTTTQPVTRGWKLHCIDAFTGEGIWNITGAMSPGAVADGYLTASCSYDGYMYVFGRGKSATTVSAPQTAIPLGQSVVLTGTVLDQSPGQPGTPCVSKDSISGWMEYLHLQKPIPADVTGVPVSLDALDPNGNYIHIGDVTTDGYSGTFGLMWTPEVPGTYAVTATFMGDDSYGSSFAQTHVGVGEALEPYPEPPEYGSPEWPEYPEAPAYTSVDLAIIAAIVVVALLVLYTLWTVRKLRK